MKYQVALGGYRIDNGTYVGEYVYNNAPNVYYEPGFNLMSPLEYTVPICDTVYFLLRRRSDIEFAPYTNPLSDNNLDITARDVSTLEELTASIAVNTRSSWNSAVPLFSPLVISVKLTSSDNTKRSRVAQVVISDRTNGESILFRVLATDIARNFSTITVLNGDEESRPTESSSNTRIFIPANDAGSYTILSPLTAFTETPSVKEATFSYPPDRIYYTRDVKHYLEDNQFSIENVSHPCLNDLVRLFHVAGRTDVAVLTVDGYASKTLAQVSGKPYLDVRATNSNGLTVNTDVLRVYFNRRPETELLD
jgi:hypothetical protein